MDAACLAVDGHGAGFYGARELDSLPDIFSMDDLLLDFGHDNAFPSPHHHHHHHHHKKFELPLPDSDAVDHNLPLFLIPCDDLAEAEWLSSFVDMSFSSEGDGEDLLLFNPNMVKPGLKEEDMSLYGKRKQEEEQGEEVLEIWRSPFSVLESSSSSSCSYSSTSTTTVEQQEKENKNEDENENKNENKNENENKNKNNKKKTMKMVAQTNPSPGRARSKRARISGPSSTAWASSRSALNLDCSSSFLIRTHNPTHHTSPSSSSSSSSSLLEMNCQNTKMKEMGRANLHEGDGQIDLKCLHCGSQKTPQWRAGPLGPKTLCNACGVRFKSGRLYPEYRPVASPSFVASVHSNSHKKVMEIRTLKQRSYYGTLPTPLAPPPNCNTTNSLPFLPKDYHLEDQWTLIRGTLN